MSKPPTFICPLCLDAAGNYNWGCLKERGLEDHLFSEHNILLPTEEHVFASEQEYHSWKVKEETGNSCTFICIRGSTITPRGKTRKYYRCNRAGHHDGLRRRGRSRRMGAHCPASYTLHTEPGLHRYSVKYKPMHFGHGTGATAAAGHHSTATSLNVLPSDAIHLASCSTTGPAGEHRQPHRSSLTSSSSLSSLPSSGCAFAAHLDGISQVAANMVVVEEVEEEEEDQIEFIPSNRPPENVEALQESITQLVQHLLVRIGDNRLGLQDLLLILSQHARDNALI